MDIFVFSLTSALNPTLLAATTAMLLLPESGRLMVGYWLGAMAMSVASGLLVVYALEGTGVTHSAKHTLSPVEDFVVAAAVLVVALVLVSGADKRVRTHRAAPGDKPKKSPKWKERLRSGTAKTTIFIGAALSLPGATYLLLLDRLSKLHYSAVVTVLVLIASNLIQLILLEVPMVAFLIWPDRTPGAIDSAKGWAARHGREYGAAALAVIGAILLVRGATGAW